MRRSKTSPSDYFINFRPSLYEVKPSARNRSNYYEFNDVNKKWTGLLNREIYPFLYPRALPAFRLRNAKIGLNQSPQSTKAEPGSRQPEISKMPKPPSWAALPRVRPHELTGGCL